MNSLRIASNLLLTAGLFGGGIYLLGQASFFLSDRWNPGTGTLFHGASLHCLAFGLLFLGSFSGTVLYSWLRGTLPMPDRSTIRPHPSYKGTVIVRFWYLLSPAVVLIVLAFLLAENAPGRLLEATPQSGAAEISR